MVLETISSMSASPAHRPPVFAQKCNAGQTQLPGCNECAANILALAAGGESRQHVALAAPNASTCRLKISSNA
jgi:hypothetical protein